MPGASGSAGVISLAWVTRAGEQTPTAAPARNYGDIRVSPDGTRVAAGVFADANPDVWIWPKRGRRVGVTQHLADPPLANGYR